jgi:hypothetical protein
LTEFDTTCNQLSEPLRGIVEAVLEFAPKLLVKGDALVTPTRA